MVLAALVVAMLIPVSAAARVGFGIGFYGGPWGYYGPYPYYGWYPYGPYGYYGYGPYGYGYGYGYGRPLGEVQIKSPDSNAQIYINGAFAGRAHDLKKIYLAPGTYNVEQRIGSDVQKDRVYVIANRTLKIEFGKVGTPSPQPLPPPGPPARPDANAAPPRPDANVAPGNVAPGRPDANVAPDNAAPPRPDADAMPQTPPPPPPPEEQR
jgi:hypothetical protein